MKRNIVRTEWEFGISVTLPEEVRNGLIFWPAVMRNDYLRLEARGSSLLVFPSPGLMG